MSEDRDQTQIITVGDTVIVIKGDKTLTTKIEGLVSESILRAVNSERSDDTTKIVNANGTDSGDQHQRSAMAHEANEQRGLESEHSGDPPD